MDPPVNPYKPPAPLQEVSQDVLNQQRLISAPTTPTHRPARQLASPLVDELTSTPRHSDAQSKIALFNCLSQNNSPTRPSLGTSNASLQRALLGREEAENALRKHHTQLAEADVRQRKISERLESLMEELQSVKERQVHERKVFEKEVRKARKDAFRASSALVKVQEDLKESRAEARSLKAEVQQEKFEKEKSKQESFERAYTLAGLLEEVETMREKMKNMEAARATEALELESHQLRREQEEQLSKEETERPEAEARVEIQASLSGPEPSSTEKATPRLNRFERADVEMTTPVEERQPAEMEDDNRTANLAASMAQEIQTLNENLQWEKTLREDAEGLVHFLRMECQFRVCSCRVAESNGTWFVHDKEYDMPMATKPDDTQTDIMKPSPRRQPDVKATKTRKAPVTASPARNKRQKQDSDMFNISKAERPAPRAPPHRPQTSPSKSAPLPRGRSPGPRFGKSSPKSPKKEVSQTIPLPLSSATIPLPLSSVTMASFQSSSSHGLVDEEDMTYQSPLRTMVRPKSARASVREPSASPPAKSPFASPHPLASTFNTPQRPGQRSLHTHNTTTTMVPLRGNDDVFSPAPGTPGTPVSREAALAQIRARRDRARSIARSGAQGGPGSARRGLVGGFLTRDRDISAPSRL